MNIGVLGAGNVGSVLGAAWAKAGHEVFFGVRNPRGEDEQAVLARCGPKARLGTPKQAAGFGDVVVIALPWDAAQEILPELDLSGKTVIDCSNPPSSLVNGAGSGAHALRLLAPRARFVKAFNMTGANNLENPTYAEGPLAMFFCGDEPEAKRKAEVLIRDASFDPYDLGPLANAALMEAQARMWIWLAGRGGLGREFGFRLVRR